MARRVIVPGKAGVRYDVIGPVRALAVAEQYVMCRRMWAPHYVTPFCLHMSDWVKLSDKPLAPGAQFPIIAGGSVAIAPRTQPLLLVGNGQRPDTDAKGEEARTDDAASGAVRSRIPD